MMCTEYLTRERSLSNGECTAAEETPDKMRPRDDAVDHAVLAFSAMTLLLTLHFTQNMP